MFFFFYAISSYFFARFVPWMMQVEIVRVLFRVDPTKGKKPRAAKKLASKEPFDVLKEARSTIKNRVQITPNNCDKFVLFLDSCTKKLACRQTRFSRIVHEGMRNVREELNIYNYMRKIRMTDAVVKATTTFN